MTVEMEMRREGDSPSDGGRQTASRLLVAVLVGAVAFAVGLGAGYLAFRPSAELAVPAEVEEFLAEWVEAWGTGDMEAILATMTENAVYDGHAVRDDSPAGFVRFTSPSVKEVFDYWTIDIMVRQTPETTHPGAPYIVAHHYAEGFDDQEGITHDTTRIELLQLVEVDGELKMAEGEHVGGLS
jgi:hypothetical protein